MSTPVWVVVETEYKGDADERQLIHALDPAAAAEEFAAHYYDGDPPDQDDTLPVSVLDGTVWRDYRVTASYSLDFNARATTQGES